MAPAQRTLVERTFHVTLADQAANRYPRVEFEVDGFDSIEATLSFSREGGAGIDMGCESPQGWRGWSGGARTSFIIARSDSTPGYIPGDLESGTWAVVLGLHTVPSHGCDVTVCVRTPASGSIDHGPADEPIHREVRGSERGLPAPPGLTWYAGDPHNHCLHSDGQLSLWQLANEGVASGLDYLGCTDHNTVSHHPHLAAVSARHGITLIPGQEMTTHRGHANAWGQVGFIDFRQPAQRWVDEAAERDAFMSINHPVSDDCSWLHPLETEPPGAELYHGSWYLRPTDTSILAWHARWKHDVVVMGGGDFHHYSTPLRPGMPTTWLAAEECTPEALIDAMKAGRTTITAAARMVSENEARPILFDIPTMIRLDEDGIIAVDAVGTVMVDRLGERICVTDQNQRLAAPRRFGPFRLEGADRRVLALCG